MSAHAYDFKMAGGLGDIIYALPTIRALGGGTLCLCPSHLTDNSFHFLSCTSGPEPFEQLAALIEHTCPTYIADCTVSAEEQEARYDLNRFRLQPDLHKRNLSQVILETFGCNPNDCFFSWLEAPSINSTGLHSAVLVHRTPRYHSPGFPWRAIVDKYSPRIAYAGGLEEHAVFCDEAGYLPWRYTATLFDLAVNIAACQIFAGNQSVGYALAEGMKRPAILEQCPECPNCNFKRDAVVVNPTVEQLPEL